MRDGLEVGHSRRLGKGVSRIFAGGDPSEVDLEETNVVDDELVAQVDVLQAGVSGRVKKRRRWFLGCRSSL